MAANHQFRNDGAGCCAVCEDPPGVGEHATTSIEEAYFAPRPIEVEVKLILTPGEIDSLQRILQNAANAGATDGSVLLRKLRELGR